MKTTKSTKKSATAIKWPSDIDPNEGWPSESTSLPDGSGRTFGDIAKALGTTVDAMCVRLGKPAAKPNKEGA